MIKKILSVLICTFILISGFQVVAEEEPTPTPETVESTPDSLGLNAKSAVLIDAKTGMVLYQKNMNQQMYPASITKILSIYIALEKLDPNAVLSASATAIDNIDRTSSHIWLDYGEEAPAIDFIYAGMMASANDAMNVLAESVSGTQEAFVALMNETAKSAGAKNSNFVNAHGLPNEAHVTTAYDMAMITRTAMRNELFKEAFGAKLYEMKPTNKQKDTRTFSTGNEMLKKSKNIYENATGGKIGWTKDAEYTMVTTATYNNMDLIAVVMGCSTSDDRYADTRKLFDYGFNNYKTVIVSKDTIESKVVEVKKGSTVLATATFTVPYDFNILLPMEMEDSAVSTSVVIRNENNPETIEGAVVLYLEGKEVGEQRMQKDIVMHDTSFQATKLPIIVQIIDYISLGVLALFVFIKFLVFLRKNTKLPE